MRVGLGVDAHRFGPEGPLMLGTVQIPHPAGLVGHSDGDVVAHAVCDAVLAACGGPDIGALFPPGDPAWARNDPTVQAGRLAADGTRLWIYCGSGTPTDPALASPDAPIGGLGFLEGMAINSNHTFADAYIAAGGNNAVFNFTDGIHAWGYAGQQLDQMKPDIQRVLGANNPGPQA